MEQMVTECPHCRKRFEVKTELAGQWVNCDGCGQPFRVQEHITQPQRYVAPRKKEIDPYEDELLEPPVQTPSYKDTPILRTSFNRSPTGPVSPVHIASPGVAPPASASPAAPARGYDLIPVGAGQGAPSYWGLKLASVLHTYGGILAVVIGLIVLAGAGQASPSSSQAGAGSGRGTLLAWGLGMTLYGTAAITAGRALAALRDIAINSFLARGSGAGPQTFVKP